MVVSVDDSAASDARALEELEIDLLLEGVFRRFGYDFRGYRRAPLRARLLALMQHAGVQTISALQDRVMHDRAATDGLLRALSMRRTALFDDAEYFRVLRTVLVPLLRSCPSPRIWIAECMSAEEVCSLSILLAEEQLYDKTQIFATAANDTLLDEAKRGVFALDLLPLYAENYRKSGGSESLDDYVGRDGAQGVFSADIRSNVTWAQYNLATDASFNEFQLIVCRRALSDFGASLQHRALQLFYDSMPLFGILSVDEKPALATPPFVICYKTLSEEHGLYRRVV
jgi:chemotaxis protein methyltransferase CheR